MSNKKSKNGAAAWLFAQYIAYNRYSTLAETYAESFPGDERTVGWETDPEVKRYASKMGRKLVAKEVVKAYIEEIQEDLCILENMTPESYQAELRRLQVDAEGVGDIKTASRIVELRGKAMGFYVERKEITHVEVLNPIQIQERMAKLLEEHPEIRSDLPVLEAKVIEEKE